MKTLLLLLVLAQTNGVALDTGVTAANLSATPTTSATDMEAVRPTNQLSLTLAVTPGTSLTVDVRCYESANNSTWDQISFCDTTTPKSACVPDVRTYTLASFAGAVKYIPSRWHVTKRWAKCSADDALDGSGTVTITGTRSWQ
jgi:hypothetical protein